MTDSITAHGQGIRDKLAMTSPEDGFGTAINRGLLGKQSNEIVKSGFEARRLHVISKSTKAAVLPS